MFRSVIILLLTGVLAACGDDQAAQPAQSAAPAAPAAPSSSAPSQPAAPESMPAAMDEEEIEYDAIDVSKLENRWWDQYTAGG